MIFTITRKFDYVIIINDERSINKYLKILKILKIIKLKNVNYLIEKNFLNLKDNIYFFTGFPGSSNLLTASILKEIIEKNLIKMKVLTIFNHCKSIYFINL